MRYRVDYLTAYQNAACASEYQALVESVKQAEARLGQGDKLARTFAKSLFKLMAYKDEYEVARLHSDPAFKQKIGGMFEGNYSIKYHLAPPLLSKRDNHGHLIKRQFGSWVGMVFPLLAKLRFLRGSVLDPFGHTEERKGERALIAEYRDTIASLLPQLSSDNLSQMVELAGIPEDIRGYGHVKERHLKNAKQKEARLLDVLKSGAKPAPSSGRHAA